MTFLASWWVEVPKEQQRISWWDRVSKGAVKDQLWITKGKKIRCALKNQ